MTKIDSFRTWGELITVTNKTVPVLTIQLYDDEWYCIEKGAGCSYVDMMDMYQHCKGVGSKIHYINTHLYFDRDTLFNIDLMFNNYDFIIK